MRHLASANFSLLLIVASLGLLSGCSKEEPLKLGFVGGLTGRVADLGIAGRNGTTLAVEEWNQRGGVRGRLIQLLVADDKQDPDIARTAATTLLDQGVVAVIGHMTSAMSVATLPLFNQRQIVLLSPTTTTEDLTAKDDYFFRVSEGNDRYAHQLASVLGKDQGHKHVAVIYDLGNKAYGESYLKGFRQALGEFGAEVSGVVSYQSGPEIAFLDLAKQVLAAKPDAVLMICNAVDTALLAQQFKKITPRLALATSPWGGTERLLSLGGQAVEGMILQQYFDRDNTAPAYLAFRRIYQERFGEEPGFASVAAYDASNLVLTALARKANPAGLKASLLEIGQFPGIQDPIRIDRFGDATRTIYSLTIRNGQFVTLAKSTATPDQP